MDVARIHILVVDDLVDAADTTVELLSIWGYDAVACYTGAAALESACLRRPNVVLLDLAMPAMDGFEFAELFHELPDCGSVPLIALSGYSSLAFWASARDVGIRHYLLKPADPECLKDLLVQEIVALGGSHIAVRGHQSAARSRRALRSKPRLVRSLLSSVARTPAHVLT